MMKLRALIAALIAIQLLVHLSITSAEQAQELGETTADQIVQQAHGRQLLSLRGKAGWLLGNKAEPKKKKSKSKENRTPKKKYIDPAEKAQRLREGRAVDLAALLELKQLVHTPELSDFSTWVEGGNPCKFAKVACNLDTGRVSEIDLIFKEDVQSLYPELQAVIAEHKANLSAQADIASVRRHSQKLLADSADDSALKPAWHVPDLPGSAIQWPSGLYPYNSTVIDSLPSGPAFMKLNRTLRALHISNAVLTDSTLPSSWGQFTGLKDLTLHGLDLRGTLPSSWSGMINMTQLLLGDNPNLHGSLPPEWDSMSQLKILDLSLSYENGLRSKLSGVLPPSWANLRKLETLDLWRTSVVGHLPASWSSLSKLQVLFLSDTGISGTLPGSWSKMPKLRAVHLANTMVKGVLPSSWGSLRSLAALDLRGTDVAQPVPNSWHAFCKKNGTRKWDQELGQWSWPKQLKYGKVAYVRFPWNGPGGKLWEINHDGNSAHNICHNLAMANRAWNRVTAIVCVCGAAIVAFTVRSRVFRPKHSHSKK